jgi:hypothetical protein
MNTVPWVALVAGGWGVWRGVGPWLADRRFRRTAGSAAGTITQMRWYQHGSGSRSRSVGHPVLRFETGDGRVVETESYAGYSAGAAEEGDRVDVLYDPAAPARARVAAPAGMEVGTLALSVVVGVLFLLFGLRGLIAQLT